jgi:hypothetical protein
MVRPVKMHALPCSEAADHLLHSTALSAQGLKGVCYYDSGWVIKDLLGRVMPLHSSPIAAREVSSACELSLRPCSCILHRDIGTGTHHADAFLHDLRRHLSSMTRLTAGVRTCSWSLKR